MALAAWRSNLRPSYVAVQPALVNALCWHSWNDTLLSNVHYTSCETSVVRRLSSHSSNRLPIVFLLVKIPTASEEQRGDSSAQISRLSGSVPLSTVSHAFRRRRMSISNSHERTERSNSTEHRMLENFKSWAMWSTIDWFGTK